MEIVVADQYKSSATMSKDRMGKAEFSFWVFGKTKFFGTLWVRQIPQCVNSREIYAYAHEAQKYDHLAIL